MELIMEYLQKKQEEILDGVYSFFEQKLNDNPEAVLHQVNGELDTMYIRFDHGWTGRGVVTDATQSATIAALEAVRAECMERIRTKNSR